MQQEKHDHFSYPMGHVEAIGELKLRLRRGLHGRAQRLHDVHDVDRVWLGGPCTDRRLLLLVFLSVSSADRCGSMCAVALRYIGAAAKVVNGWAQFVRITMGVLAHHHIDRVGRAVIDIILRRVGRGWAAQLGQRRWMAGVWEFVLLDAVL